VWTVNGLREWEWMELAQDRVQWWAFVSTVLILMVLLPQY